MHLVFPNFIQCFVQGYCHTAFVYCRNNFHRRIQNIRPFKMELFVKLVNGRKLLTILAQSSILDVRLGSEYASGFSLWKSNAFDYENLKQKFHF